MSYLFMAQLRYRIVFYVEMISTFSLCKYLVVYMSRKSQQALLSFSKEIPCRLYWLITLLTDSGALQKTLTIFIKWCRLTFLLYFYGEWNCIYILSEFAKGYLQDFLATASFEACSVLDRFFFYFLRCF